MDSAKQENAQDVYGPLVRQGEAELQRKPIDLAISGLICGLDISFGALAMVVVAGRLNVTFHLPIGEALFFGSFLYPLGFIFVIMGKSELFTENTLTPVAGMLNGQGTIAQLARSWSIILTSNIVGTILFCLLASQVSVVFHPYTKVYQTLALRYVQEPFLQAALAAMLAGWLVALIGWLIQSTKGSITHFVIIYAIAYLLSALSLYHAIIGSSEVLLGMFAGAPIRWGSWLGSFLLPAVLGNAIGGIIFVTGLKAFQAGAAGTGDEADAGA